MLSQKKKYTNTWSALGILLLCFTMDLINGQPREYCEGETFNPACQSDEVVVIESGYYGRKRLGRCTKTDLGYIGCSANVRHHLDSKCSGHRTCNLLIPGPLYDLLPCPADLESYLEASYTCIKVESASCHMCQSMTHAVVTQDKGYLASVVSEESHTGCGTARCPWRIEVPPGQRVNLTLFDFGSVAPPSGACLVNAIIKEKGSSQLTICHSNTRESHIYLSRTNVVEISLVSMDVSEQRAKFMIYYEAVGCLGMGENEMNEMCESTSSTVKLKPLKIGWTVYSVIVLFLHGLYKSWIA